MKIKNQEKPTENQIKQYRDRLKDLLSAHNIEIIINIKNTPIEWKFYENGVLKETRYEWIDSITINNFQGPAGELINLTINLPEYHYDFNEDGWSVFNDALLIQNKLYEITNKKLDFSNSNDPYWQIFHIIKKNK